MNRRREVSPLKSKKFLLPAAIVCALVLFAAIFLSTHVFVSGQFYSKNTESLDLRGNGMGIAEYEALRAALPDCVITWDVPFQGGFYPQDTKELTITGFSSEDAASLPYFPSLASIDATGCSDAEIRMLREICPGLDLSYTVPIDGKDWPQDTKKLTVTSLTAEDVERIALLDALTAIDAGNCRDLDALKEIGLKYPGLSLTYNLTVCGETFSRFAEELALTQADPAVLIDLLWHMPDLKTLNLASPVGNASDLLYLMELYPEVAFSWNREVLGIEVTCTDTEVDLSGTAPASLSEIREEMEWFPSVEKLILCDLEFDNDTMAAFREEMRSQYKVVWNVDVGYLTMRTDEIYYMPGKYNLGVTDEQAYNLRYFEDMICIDVGHKPLFNCEWAAFMPNLKYLIIADTYIDDISPLAGHDQLIYLEMFITKVTDLTPLLSCTALEDLNLCYTHADPEPITKMTWLKNLWWAEPPIEEAEFQEYLPDTHLMFLHHSSTGNGWRQLQNYYDMRDILGMHYMWG